MRTVVTVAGMRGEHCRRAIFTALTPVGGIRSAEVMLGRIVIEHDGTVTETALREAIGVTGYVITDVADDRRTLPMADDSMRHLSI